ncbi:MAG: VWA domain-containing protein [Deferribacteraceae bacterium]|jgi:uncharacterized protein YegL|nr:VWA domain-containing protein [Deferribacteraceae bacterium]
MSLNDFVLKEPRALPIFILADTSGSMNGEKINELNLALREMTYALKNVDDIRGKFQLAVVGFGGEVSIVQQLADIGTVSIAEMSANGNTPMGEAFDIVCAMINDKNIVNSRSYTPTLVLISDGQPTDFMSNNRNYLDWEPLKKLHTGIRSAKCQRLAMGIGADADMEMLKAFVKNPEIPVIKANNASGITAFFRWVTMSAILRLNSVNPNVASVVAPVFDFDSEDIVI